MVDRANRGPANNTDFPPVSVFFEDEIITELFSDLLEVRGIRTKILNGPNEHTPETRIITEPQFFPLLDVRDKKFCLVVGNPDAVQTCDALTLTRPLTERKIDDAIRQLLSYSA